MVVTRLAVLLFASTLIACGGGTGSADEGPPENGDTGTSDTANGGDTGEPDTTPTETGPSSCALRPKCDAPLPDLGPKSDWRHTSTKITVALGSARHRGRDQFYKPGSKQWAIGKFAYGANDDDIKDEDVDVYLLRDCGTTWKKLGTYQTTQDGAHTTEEGVIDTGGRIYVDISSVDAPLGVGRHRIHFVVKGDLSGADQFIEVLPDGARIVVSDIDGTLTTSESASWTEAFGASPPGANPGSPEVLTTLAERGFYVFFLTARPEWFVQKTRDWLTLRGFPPGMLHTTFSIIGETGSAAIEFKTSELATLKTKTGITPTYGFGNTDSDSAAYENANLQPPANRYFFKYTDTRGGTTHDDYSKLVPGFAALPAVCL